MSAAVKITTANTPKHFLDLRDVPGATLRHILTEAARYKRTRGGGGTRNLAGKTLAMIFEKPSTRTRISFEVAIRELGGNAITLSPTDMQIGRGETIADTANVLSRYVHAIMLRTTSAAKLQELAAHASIPVINGLTELTHPCQIMADILTFEEHRGPIAGQTVAWLGDGNNVAASWIEAATLFNFSLRLACPPGYHPKPATIAWAKSQNADIAILENPIEAVTNAACVVTDTWLSMADSEAETETRIAALTPYQVNQSLMNHAPHALVMHCLPAHRGEEITAEVIDGPASVVFDEAENRLHAQKAILAWCLG